MTFVTMHPEDSNKTDSGDSCQFKDKSMPVAVEIKKWALSRMFLLDQQDRTEDSLALKNEFQI